METKELARTAIKAVANGKTSHSEGPVAKGIESQTAKLPSDVFLWTGLGCLALSAIFGIRSIKTLGSFFGHMAAPILVMGLYNKLVKLEGSDKYTKNPERNV